MKKSALIFILSFFVFNNVFAQDLCGTIVTKEDQAKLNNRQSALNSFARKTTSVLYVPIHIHIVGNNSGAGYFNKADAYQIVCGLNIHFAPLSIVFFLEGPITYINNTTYYNPSTVAVTAMMDSFNVSHVCNIYMVPQLTGLCGYTYLPASGPDHGRGGIVLNNSCALPGNTDPVHEMGHYFSMVHTFQFWGTSLGEFVDESNCATHGDNYCDTRADCLNYRWNCPIVCKVTDAHGDTCKPDSSLFMSYSNSPCPSRFSPLQQAAITYSRINERIYLDSTAVPVFNSLGNASLLTPADNDVNVPSSNNALFSWNAVPGATEYNIRIKDTSSLHNFTDNSIYSLTTTDTFIAINGFTVGNYYNWKVLPVSYSSTCITCDSASSQKRTFSVIYSTGIAELNNGIQDIQLYPNPVTYEHEVTLDIAVSIATDAHVQLINVNGQIVYRGELSLKQGANKVTIPVRSLATGVYSCNIVSNEFKVVRRLVKMPE
jgi:hypothetical protein